MKGIIKEKLNNIHNISFDKFYKELKNGKYKDKKLIISPTRIPKFKKINFFEFIK